MSKYVYIVNCSDTDGEDTTCLGVFTTHEGAVDSIMTERYEEGHCCQALFCRDESECRESQRKKIAKANFLENDMGGYTIKKVKLK